MIKLYNIILEALSDNAKKKAKEKFKKENPELTDSVIDYYLNKFSDKQQSPIITNKDIMQYKFEDLEKLIDKNFPKTNDSSGDDEVDFKGSEDVVLNENGLLVLLGDLKEKCIRYGKGYSWCISRKDQSNMFFSYRMRLNEPVFYFIFDEDKPKDDKFHAMVIYINAEGEYYVASASNEGDKKMSWSEIEELQPKLKGHKDLFKHVPLSSGEREDYNKFKDPNKSYDWYKDLSYEEKEKYIGFGHDLTEDQISDTPKPLISKYATTTVGANIPKDIEKGLPLSDQKVLRKNREQLHSDKDYVKLVYYPEDVPKEGMTIPHNLSLAFSNIKKLPDNLNVNGDLNLQSSKIRELPENLKVNGFANFDDTVIESIPESTKFHNSTLSLERSHIKKLPNNLRVVNLFLKESKIESLPEGLKVLSSLDLTLTRIKTLPQGIKIGNHLILRKCTELEKLPDNLKVGGMLDLRGSDIKELPSGLQVDGNLFLENTPITYLPKDLKVGDSIFFNKELSSKYKKNSIFASELEELQEYQDSYSKALNEYLKQ